MSDKANGITLSKEKGVQNQYHIDILLANICVEAKNKEAYNTHEEELGDAQERLTALMIKLAELGAENKKDECRNLPVFSGNLHEWISIKDLFEAVVHHNSQLTGAQKLQYCKGLLQGEAAALVKSIPVSSVNYIEAWTILNARYENKLELIDSTLKQLFSQPAVQHESVSMLRRLEDTVLEYTQLLKVVGQRVKHWDSVLEFLVIEKLDSDSKHQWLSLKKDKLPTFSQLTEFLKHCRRALA
ncbi:hypothetical protein PR048_032167 [Dryococelus australis]|uniref:Uncharacterized protein n=1 Tax=Dryococelus australis TaxID=614101 RepID=A0ABQ9G5K2_9NEOP|nr:hypothetical protein PR048_032167 [Dryococelus australis]